MTNIIPKNELQKSLQRELEKALPFGQIVACARDTAARVRNTAWSGALDMACRYAPQMACRYAPQIPVIAQNVWAQPQVQALRAKITQFTQSIPYLEPFTGDFIGSIASIGPQGVRSCAFILSSMSGASAATARILKAGHTAMKGAAETEELTQSGNFVTQMGEAVHDSVRPQQVQGRLAHHSESSALSTSSSSSSQPSIPVQRTLEVSDRLTIVQAQGKTAQAWKQVLQSVEPSVNNLVRTTAQTTGAWHLCTGLLRKLESYGSGTDEGIQKVASGAFQFVLNAQIARKLYQNVRNASGRWNQVKQLAAIGLLGAGVEAIHRVFKTDTLKTAQTLALLTMFPRTTEAWMFTQAAVCAGAVGGTIGALKEYNRRNGSLPEPLDALRVWAESPPQPDLQEPLVE